MHLSTPLLPLALALRASALYDDWHFGNMFALGPTSDNIHITKATYSLVPPAVPCGAQQNASATEAPWLSLWVGLSASMSDQQADLFQPLLNWSPDQASQACPASSQEWCVATSTYHSSGQVQEAYVPVPNDSELEFTITVDEGSNKIIQRISVNGKEVSHQADDKTVNPTFIYSSNECYLDACGTLSAYSWKNMTIHLSGADLDFQNTIALDGARDSGMTTPDNGKTWHINSMRVDRDYFYPDQQEHECGSD